MRYLRSGCLSFSKAVLHWRKLARFSLCLLSIPLAVTNEWLLKAFAPDGWAMPACERPAR